MFINLDGRKIYYDLTGPDNGPAVCFTHSLSSDGGMWAEQMPGLINAGYRVLRLDMRGHGGSDPVDGDYTMEALADDVAVSLDALGIDKVQFVGLSIGGMIGQAFAIKYPNRLISAMLCDTMPATPEGGEAAWGPRLKIVRDAGSVEPLADPTMERWFTAAFKPRNAGRWRQIRETIAGTTAAGYLGCGAAILNFDFREQHKVIKAPTLVVCGDQDEGTPPAGNKLIAESVADGRYEEIANARHFPNVEHPEVFNRLMMPWLEQHK
jgi:3-oxoadipate enol-lactonase